jgi:hypothetical protein
VLSGKGVGMSSSLSTFDSPKVAKANSPIPLLAVVLGDHLTLFSMITFFSIRVTAVVFGDHLTLFSVVKNTSSFSSASLACPFSIVCRRMVDSDTTV